MFGIGTRLSDRYELTAELGHGGMGVVYRARDPVLAREVAVKMIPPARLSEETEQRFERAAQVVARMDHPSIVPIHDYGRHQGTLFFVMPLLRGDVLQTLVRERRLSLGEAVEIAVQTAEALAYSHSRGIVHRDVKPANLMVSRQASGVRVRVMDFGLARGEAERRLTGTGELVGTPANLSPEQITGAALDGRCDLYSLGTVLYECLAGEPPFVGAVHAMIYRILHEAPRPPRDLGPEVDEELDSIVLKCLEKEPSERFQSGLELAAALTRYRRGLTESELSRPLLTSAPAAASPPTVKVRPPLIGRRAEQAALQRRLKAAVAGECQLVLLAGEAGVGKTELLQELEKLALARRVRVLQGRFWDREETFPYQGLCEVIQDYFRSSESPGGDSSEGGTPASGRRAERASVSLSDLATDLTALFPVLSEVRELRRAVRREGAPPASARLGDRAFVSELLARCLARLAGGQPLAVLLEGLHAGGVSIEALQYIVRRLGATPTLIVGTYRPSEAERDHPVSELVRSFEGDPRFELLRLSPFGPEEHRRLVEQLVGSPRLSEDLLQRLFEVTEGNPLFTQEAVRSLVENGDIRRDDSGIWELMWESGPVVHTLPGTMQQAAERRLERLSDELRAVLAVASVLGKQFDDRDLTALVEEAGDAVDVDEAIDALVGCGILQEGAAHRGHQLSFASGALRDVLYQELPRRRRRRLHQRHARHLERRHARCLEQVYPQLMHHFSLGDVADKTMCYGLELARRSLAAAGATDAVRAARTALELADDESVEEAPRLEAELRLTLARALVALGRPGRGLAEAERAVAVCERAADLERAAAAALLAAETAWQSRRVEAARRWVDRGAELARRCGAFDTLRRHLRLAARVANLAGETQRARLYLEEAEHLVPAVDEGLREEPVPVGGRLVVALGLADVELDPARILSNEEYEASATVFETLLGRDEEGYPVPGLVSDWESGEGGERFVLSLRDGVRFSDGTPLTARRVRASLERAASLRGDLPALASLAGSGDFAAGRADHIRGIEVAGERRLILRLSEPLPILPALLTDPKTAITHPGSGDGDRTLPLGTGSFRPACRQPQPGAPRRLLLLERNPVHRGPPARLEELELRLEPDASAIAAGLRAGEIDIARGLLPDDLDDAMRDPRFRRGLVETTRLSTYFVLWNVQGPGAQRQQLRQALSRVVRVRDLVWRTLGRFAQPALGLIPPGLLGHDPGRRAASWPAARAAAELRGAGIQPPTRLRAAVHPQLLDRYAALTSALLEVWATLGVEVEVVTTSMSSYVQRLHEPGDLDLAICRWVGEYADADSFTHSLFDSRTGLLRGFFASEEADRLLLRARRESRGSARERLYRRFEDLLRRESVALPLFHEIDYRVAGPQVRALRLGSAPPYVRYASLGKAAPDAVEPVAPRSPDRRSAVQLHVPIASPVASVDPLEGGIADHFEVVSSVFETLTRVDEEARVIPWLAESFTAEAGGGRYRLGLRSEVRFHDGRRLTSRDVRYSFERLLRFPDPHQHFLLLPIRGAAALRDGEAASLAGLEIVSATELVLELARPLPFFPALLAHPGVSIVPEGCEKVRGGWRDGAVGSGPFRILRHAPAARLDLERNPGYWRRGAPRSERLSFHFGVSPDTAMKELRSGGFALVSQIHPADLAAVRGDAALAAGFRHAPRLVTHMLVLNTHRGPFADAALRRALAGALEVEAAVRETVGGIGSRAHGLLPPGLLGYEAPRSPRPPVAGDASALAGLAVRAVAPSAYAGHLAGFWDRLREQLEALGMSVDLTVVSAAEQTALTSSGDLDLALHRWVADYPDSDAFVHGLLDSSTGQLRGMVGSAQLDRLSAAGRHEADPGLRHAAYREVEEILRRDALLLPLFHEQAVRCCQPSLRGLRLGLTVPEVRYEELWLEG